MYVKDKQYMHHQEGHSCTLTGFLSSCARYMIHNFPNQPPEEEYPSLLSSPPPPLPLLLPESPPEEANARACLLPELDIVVPYKTSSNPAPDLTLRSPSLCERSFPVRPERFKKPVVWVLKLFKLFPTWLVPTVDKDIVGIIMVPESRQLILWRVYKKFFFPRASDERNIRLRKGWTWDFKLDPCNQDTLQSDGTSRIL